MHVTDHINFICLLFAVFMSKHTLSTLKAQTVHVIQKSHKCHLKKKQAK